jgi:hypothetical protein
MLENFTERDFSVITLNFNEITITTLNYKKKYHISNWTDMYAIAVYTQNRTHLYDYSLDTMVLKRKKRGGGKGC